MSQDPGKFIDNIDENRAVSPVAKHIPESAEINPNNSQNLTIGERLALRENGKRKAGRPPGPRPKRQAPLQNVVKLKEPAASHVRSLEIAWVEEQLLLGRPNPTIEIEGAEKFNTDLKTVRLWTKQVYARWEESNKEHAKNDRVKMRTVMENLFDNAVRLGDLRAATAIADRLCRVMGLFEPLTEAPEAGAQVFRSPDKVRERMTELMNDPEVAKKLEMMVKK